MEICSNVSYSCSIFKMSIPKILLTLFLLTLLLKKSKSIKNVIPFIYYGQKSASLKQPLFSEILFSMIFSNKKFSVTFPIFHAMYNIWSRGNGIKMINVIVKNII